MVYKISGPSIVHTVGAAAANDVLPPHEDVVGQIPRWVHVEIVTSVTAYVRTGLVGDSMTAPGQGISIAINTGGKVLAVGSGHTHIQSYASGVGSLIVTPLGGDPRE